MALFGSVRDVSTFKGISKEVISTVISQQCGYYKVVLSDTPVNVYGESGKKNYIGPVLIDCLIDRGDFTYSTGDFGPDVSRQVTFNFLKDHLVDANIVPEIGDVIMYDELYYQVDDINENQLVVGKDPDYSYSAGLENFGSSYSIITKCHYVSPEIVGIAKNRL